jgi:hypothetical protein
MAYRTEDDTARPAPQNGPPVKARQGMLGTPVLMVLIAALVLAAVAWWGAEIFGESIAPPASEQVGNPATVPPAQPGGPPANQP